MFRKYCSVNDDVASQLAPQYPQTILDGNKRLQRLLTSPTRYQAITERGDCSDIPISVYDDSISLGKYVTLYRDSVILKKPQELSVYQQFFYHMRPSTVIELGTFSGASAAWFADTATVLGLNCHLYSLDIDHTLIDEAIMKTKPENVTFILGDSYRIGEAFPLSMLQTLPHPWLVIEDVHHNCINVLNYMNSFMKAGDYIVVEDTDPREPSKLTLPPQECEPIGSGKLNMLKTFVKECDHQYLVDSFFTDFYGYNCTWNWHGFLKKMK